MSQLPEKGFLRLPQIIGNPNAKPPIPAIVPVSKSTWWNGCSSGKFPKPIKLGPRTTVWAVADILDLIEKMGDQARSGSIGATAIELAVLPQAEPLKQATRRRTKHTAAELAGQA
jgi:prophage regulatory protein